MDEVLLDCMTLKQWIPGVVYKGFRIELRPWKWRLKSEHFRYDGDHRCWFMGPLEVFWGN